MQSCKKMINCSLMFPQMFISLIASSLNDILLVFIGSSIIGDPDVARTLFKHFLKETKSIFNPKSPYGSELLLRVLPLIHDLHSQHFKDIALPSGIPPKLTEMRERRPELVEETISEKMKEIRDNCFPYSKDKLPACFHHIIDAIFLFPYAPELAMITSELSKEIVLVIFHPSSLISFLMPCVLFMGKIFSRVTRVCAKLLLLQNSTGITWPLKRF